MAKNSSPSLSAEIDGDFLVVRIRMNDKPERSASGKSLVVATTSGNKALDVQVDGKDLILGLNAYIKA